MWSAGSREEEEPGLEGYVRRPQSELTVQGGADGSNGNGVSDGRGWREWATLRGQQVGVTVTQRR